MAMNILMLIFFKYFPQKEQHLTGLVWEGVKKTISPTTIPPPKKKGGWKQNAHAAHRAPGLDLPVVSERKLQHTMVDISQNKLFCGYRYARMIAQSPRATFWR